MGLLGSRMVSVAFAICQTINSSELTNLQNFAFRTLQTSDVQSDRFFSSDYRDFCYTDHSIDY